MVRSGLIFFILLIAQITFASAFNNCLATAKKIQHRLDRADAIQACFEANKMQITSEACFSGIKSIEVQNKSIELTEKLNSICFYETTAFKNTKSCLARTDEFKIATNHDNAVFECYRQFQNKINKKNCLAISSLLKYPAKKEYLQNHCYESVN